VVDLPFIQVNLVEGRTEKQREELTKAITDAFVKIIGNKREDVWILFNDMPKTHFAIGGVLRNKE
jgi:4-oxalocrotonate tautomerase